MLRYGSLLAVLLVGLVGISFAQDSTPIPDYHLTPSPTPLFEPADAELLTCVEPDPDLAPPEGIDSVRVPMLDYLNAGGTIAPMREALSTYISTSLPMLSQLLLADITQDGEPEIFLATTLASTFTGSEGDTYLFMYRCEDGAYTERQLFVRAGAGIRSVGLYAGGGVRIMHIGDVNANGLTDVLYMVVWDSPEFGENVEYQLGDFDDNTFTSLFEPVPDDAYRVYATVLGEDGAGLTIEDLDEDGVQELIIDGVVYRWDGQYYLAED